MNGFFTMEKSTLFMGLAWTLAFSIFFSIGIGPSSSHTVGPIKADWDFIHSLAPHPLVNRIKVTLHGSLAHTGQSHLTHHAILMGL